MKKRRARFTKKQRQIIFTFFGLQMLLLTGCSLVPTDGWPKPAWYWSYEAEQHRKEVAEEKSYNKNPPPAHTNYFAPENPLLDLGPNDLTHDIVSTNSGDGIHGYEIVRIHDGWIYRFYSNGGIDSITQQPKPPPK